MKETIISLIEQDIKHNQLLNGLYSIGLNDDDSYTLNLDIIISKLMGNPKASDSWLSLYHKTMLEISNSISGVEKRQIAEKLYVELKSI
jgi:hypothetical protein